MNRFSRSLAVTGPCRTPVIKVVADHTLWRMVPMAWDTLFAFHKLGEHRQRLTAMTQSIFSFGG